MEKGQRPFVYAGDRRCPYCFNALFETTGNEMDRHFTCRHCELHWDEPYLVFEQRMTIRVYSHTPVKEFEQDEQGYYHAKSMDDFRGYQVLLIEPWKDGVKRVHCRRLTADGSGSFYMVYVPA